MAVGERAAEPGPWTRATRSVTSHAGHAISLLVPHHQGRPRRGHPFFDAYHIFLVQDPTKSLAPLNGLKTPPYPGLLRINKIRSEKKEEKEESFCHYYSESDPYFANSVRVDLNNPMFASCYYALNIYLRGCCRRTEEGAGGPRSQKSSRYVQVNGPKDQRCASIVYDSLSNDLQTVHRDG
ncbi:hypothetical protein ARMSODRAFT_983472 [Armillaria solidipes]|uniref:Uncharacterized protein n=1 Tax=Armillaria solidipes TaxID=1076256 RepID=A0A2H3AVG9_9AGAR|nr:hypothetical protein ARMSODRAFT_983472 [Armillaria solidipes]